MAASGGEIRLLTVSDPTGREVYNRTAQFVIFLALRRLWPQARCKMNCTLGEALYIEVDGAESFDADRLREEISSIVQADIPLLRRRVSTKDAMAAYAAQGLSDKARLLSWREAPTFDEYYYGDFSDYYYGELAPSTRLFAALGRESPGPRIPVLVPIGPGPGQTGPVASAAESFPGLLGRGAVVQSHGLRERGRPE